MIRLNFHTWIAEHKELLNLPLRTLAFHVSLVFAERVSKDKVQRAIRSGALVLHNRKHEQKVAPTKKHSLLFHSLYAELFERVFPAPAKVASVKPCAEHDKCFQVRRKTGEMFHAPAERVRTSSVPYIGKVSVASLALKNKVEMRKVSTLEVWDLRREKRALIPVVSLRKWHMFNASGEKYMRKGESVREKYVQEIAHLKTSGKLTFKTRHTYIESESARSECGRVLRSIKQLFSQERESVGLHLVGSPLLQGSRTWKTLISERDLVQECALVLWYLILAEHPILQDKEKLTSYLVSVAYNVMRSYFSLVTLPRTTAQGEPILDKDGNALTRKVRKWQPIYYMGETADIYQRENGLFALVNMGESETE